ncbi:hypothetical protein F4813DRAFT_373059 [Daldinia decipiens]|uniref:uncharacterized protein n=1 Tax=Daldinia decipiens TaxID=326647 RepID=UPI0020C2DC76|nr:uncharacterized protein F4813DRAFT_373059 [Daldinia decipiens]KAI1653867.1 hypothetical protein F4813DRAFT_373059 [Daldinia decipiens]
MPPDRNTRVSCDPPPEGQHRTCSTNSNTGLVWVSDLDTSRKLLRSHIAKRTHAIVRRKGVLEYQQQKETPNSVPGRSTTPLNGGMTSEEYHRNQAFPVFYTPYDNRAHDYHIPHWITTHTPSPRGDSFNHSPVPLSSFENSLMSHYISTIVNGYSSSPYSSYQHAAMNDWLPVAIADPGMRMGLFLCASRSLYARTGAWLYFQYDLQYKAVRLRILSNAIRTALETTETESISAAGDVNISTALQLASDESAAGDAAALKRHISAVSQMVSLNGGLENIKGMNGFLKVMINILVCKHRRMIESTGFDNQDRSRLYTLDYFFSYLI